MEESGCLLACRPSAGYGQPGRDHEDVPPLPKGRRRRGAPAGDHRWCNLDDSWLHSGSSNKRKSLRRCRATTAATRQHASQHDQQPSHHPSTHPRPIPVAHHPPPPPPTHPPPGCRPAGAAVQRHAALPRGARAGGQDLPEPRHRGPQGQGCGARDGCVRALRASPLMQKSTCSCGGNCQTALSRPALASVCRAGAHCCGQREMPASRRHQLAGHRAGRPAVSWAAAPSCMDGCWAPRPAPCFPPPHPTPPHCVVDHVLVSCNPQEDRSWLQSHPPVFTDGCHALDQTGGEGGERWTGSAASAGGAGFAAVCQPCRCLCACLCSQCVHTMEVQAPLQQRLAC